MSTDASLPTTARGRPLGRPRSRRRFPRGRSDDALVARVRAGDERAFELVFDRYHRSLLAFCRHMLASNEEAEDALQHTFMAAYRALRTSERPIRLKAWLYTIARNRCLSVLRARREHAALDDGHAASDGLAADVERRAELRGLLADLEQLAEEQRAALVLFELGDHSHDEIAEILGVRREKVKALVFQARESLAGWRRARETPCVEIREQLATARGAAFKRATLRRHVARCEGCAAFEAEVRRQRVAMAGAAPGGADGGAEGGDPGRRGLSAGGGGSLAGLGGAAKGVAAKTLLCAAVAGSAGSAGYVAVREVELHDARGPVAATASDVSHKGGHGGARAVKPSVSAQTAAPVVVAAAAPAAAPARPAVASDARGRHGKQEAWMRRDGRHHRHGAGDGPRRAAATDGRGRGGDSQRGGQQGGRGGGGRGGGERGGFGRSGAQPGDSGRGGTAQRKRFADRGGSTRPGTSAERGNSAGAAAPPATAGPASRGAHRRRPARQLGAAHRRRPARRLRAAHRRRPARRLRAARSLRRRRRGRASRGRCRPGRFLGGPSCLTVVLRPQGRTARAARAYGPASLGDWPRSAARRDGPGDKTGQAPRRAARERQLRSRSAGRATQAPRRGTGLRRRRPCGR